MDLGYILLAHENGEWVPVRRMHETFLMVTDDYATLRNLLSGTPYRGDGILYAIARIDDQQPRRYVWCGRDVSVDAITKTIIRQLELAKDSLSEAENREIQTALIAWIEEKGMYS